jgi:hypothetical protein
MLLALPTGVYLSYSDAGVVRSDRKLGWRDEFEAQGGYADGG